MSISYPEFDNEAPLTATGLHALVVVDQGEEQTSESIKDGLEEDVWKATGVNIARSFEEPKQYTIRLASSITTRSETESSAVESLESLLSQVTTGNLHTEIDWGRPVGREEW